jgi:hypothetical protein
VALRAWIRGGRDGEKWSEVEILFGWEYSLLAQGQVAKTVFSFRCWVSSTGKVINKYQGVERRLGT